MMPCRKKNYNHKCKSNDVTPETLMLWVPKLVFACSLFSIYSNVEDSAKPMCKEIK